MLFELTGATKQIGHYTLHQVKYLMPGGRYEIGGWLDKPELLLNDPRSKVGANSYVYGTKFTQKFVIGENCTVANCIINCKLSAHKNVTLNNCTLWNVGDNFANCQEGLNLYNREFHAIGRIDPRLNDSELFKEFYYGNNVYALVADKCCGTGCVTVDWLQALTIVNSDDLWNDYIASHNKDARINTIKTSRDWLRSIILEYMPKEQKERLHF